MTYDGLNSMVYDAENRVTSAAGLAGSATYSYDGKSLRVKKVSGRTTTVYIYSGPPAVAGTKVIAEYENGAAPSAPTRECIYSGGARRGGLAKIESGAVQYYHADHLSARMMTDSSGNIIGQQGHYPFGQSWYQTNTTTKWLFTSYERDSESGNDYATFRYNVNRLGRYASPDLIAGSRSDPQSLNRYAYVRDDPANLVDPLGLTGELVCVFLGSRPVGCTSSDTRGPDWEFDVGPQLGFGGGLPDHGGGGGPGWIGNLPLTQNLSGLAVLGMQQPCSELQSKNPALYNFVAQNYQDAETLAALGGTTAANLLGQAALESLRPGGALSNIAANYGNYFGLTYGYQFASSSGQPYRSPNGLSYATFPAGQGIFSSGMALISSPYYGPRIAGAITPQQYASALVGGLLKFNPSPSYPGLLGSVIGQVAADLGCF